MKINTKLTILRHMKNARDDILRQIAVCDELSKSPKQTDDAQKYFSALANESKDDIKDFDAFIKKIMNDER